MIRKKFSGMNSWFPGLRLGPGAITHLLVLGAIFLGSTQGFSREVSRVIDHPSGLESGAWVATNVWDEAAEQEFSNWIQALGEAREKNSFRLAKGLSTPEFNPLYTEEDAGLKIETDCANLPYALRVYFAYKTKRPFAYIGFTWKRYAADNRPRDLVDWAGSTSFGGFYAQCLSTVNSGHFRMDATLEATDTYPISITSQCLRPGVVYYDPNGHVMVVYKVNPETGEILMLDSHPDGTLTRKVFNTTMAVGSARFGGAFRGWRQDRIEVVDAEKGAFRVVREANSEAACYNPTEQYQGVYLVEGEELTYHEWVRYRMSGQGLEVEPISEFDNRLTGFCRSVSDRVDAVNEAMTQGIHNKSHPGELPWNIYQASGTWEAYASPGRDARLRLEAKELHDFIVRTVSWNATGNRRLIYKGTTRELLAEFQRIWTEHLASPDCRYTYTNSQGSEVTFNVADVFRRLYALSFDPYHCPEMRWGGVGQTPDGTSPELATCPTDRRKQHWYKKEQRLRNRYSRLLGKATWDHRGPEEGAPADVASLLECYSDQTQEYVSCDVKTP